MHLNGDPLLVLGIESSCDETSASVVRLGKEGAPEILANIIFSQFAEHGAFGGVVPEIAARAHTERFDMVIEDALRQSGVALEELDGIAVTSGPGLIGGLIAGLMTAKAVAASLAKPLYGINHLEGHALSPRLIDDVQFPYLLLLVSGGHTQILLVRGIGDYERWGTTLDDALGEAFDKIAKLLGLGYPGGPAVESAAVRGKTGRFSLPQPLRGDPGCNFSFSGLKTAVRRVAEDAAPVTDEDIDDICRAFQDTVAAAMADRVENALERFKTEFADIAEPALVVAGGVAANQALRSNLSKSAGEYGARLVAPPAELCSDNAAMIAWAAIERMRSGYEADIAAEIIPRPRWPLDSDSAPLIGSGKRGAKA